MYFVSRQCNYYDEGAYSVEIALALDVSGPGALVAKYSGELEEYDDPREAASAAIGIAGAWRKDLAQEDKADELPAECFTVAGNALVYPTVADAFTADELTAWAQERYERLPRCEVCGDVVASGEKYRDEFGESFAACCDVHAETYLEREDSSDDE
jgi:hypothetical protein